MQVRRASADSGLERDPGAPVERPVGLGAEAVAARLGNRADASVGRGVARDDWWCREADGSLEHLPIEYLDHLVRRQLGRIEERARSSILRSRRDDAGAERHDRDQREEWGRTGEGVGITADASDRCRPAPRPVPGRLLADAGEGAELVDDDSGGIDGQLDRGTGCRMPDCPSVGRDPSIVQ